MRLREALEAPAIFGRAWPLVALERRRRAAARDVVDHPPGQNDDRCNSAVGTLLLASRRSDHSVYCSALRPRWHGVLEEDLRPFRRDPEPAW